jgi:6-phosphogluconolactonase (cycloisomerase 2 family)
VPLVAAASARIPIRPDNGPLRMDASGRFLYVMNTTDGVVSSYSIDAAGSVTLVNTLPSPGATSMVPFLLQ